jgi:Pentapeptide repeats (8 copies)
MSDSSYRIITLVVPAWNQWRQSHPDVKPNLDAARLAGADLSGCDLDDVVLFEADLEGTNLARAQLRGAVL